MLGVRGARGMLDRSSSPTAVRRAARGMRCCSPAAATTSSTIPMALWIKDLQPGASPGQLSFNQGRASTPPSTLVRAGYEDLIAPARQPQPATRACSSMGYDFAIPDGRGICHLGPWLKPTFDLRGFPTQAAAHSAVTKTHAASSSPPMLDGRSSCQHAACDVHQQPGDAGAPAGLLAQRAASVERRVQGLCETVARRVEGGIPKPGPVAALRRREL